MFGLVKIVHITSSNVSGSKTIFLHLSPLRWANCGITECWMRTSWINFSDSLSSPLDREQRLGWCI